jgi:DNA-binding response OmpR family regulator
VEILASPPGRLRSREELLARLWGDQELVDDRTLDAHMRRLRRKLEPDPANPRYLQTVRGVGFRLDEPDGSSALGA